MIIEALVGNYVIQIAQIIEGGIGSFLGIEDELRELQSDLQSIQGLLEDAEKRRLRDPDVNTWVVKLKDAIYDADDINDLCRLKDEQKTPESSSSVNRMVRNPLSFLSRIRDKRDISNRIRSVKARLKEITRDTRIISKLQSSLRFTRGVDQTQTDPLLESVIVGGIINQSARTLVNLIVKESREKSFVTAILGMAGIGKTTLAQNIFNDQILTSSFEIRVWVCVTQEVNEIGLLKQIINSAGFSCAGADNKPQLVELLKLAISGKSFFLVLDDMWNSDVWVNLLRKPIESNIDRHRVLVTTRNENIALEMGSIHNQKMEILPDDSGWELLYKKVNQVGHENEIQSLKDVGIKIVKKCQGLPLAITAIAGVLRRKGINKEKWSVVLNNDIWSQKEISEKLRALYLCYEDLPSHLKQSFLHCALFPAGHEFYKENFVRYWVAEGFVVDESDRILEDIAEEYFEELVSRSLLQQYSIYVRNPCIMHDLLRTFALNLSKDECFYGDVQKVPPPSSHAKLRRLSIANIGEKVCLPRSIVDQKCLRSLLLLKSPPKIENEIFLQIQHLRFLLLNGPAIDNIPDSIGDLIHLRYLDLNYSDISKLPDSLRNLTNLQFLNLVDCKSLRTLPMGITRLGNLRRLGLYGSSITYIPKGVGGLIFLNSLSFIIGNQGCSYSGEQGCELGDLDLLCKLRYLGVHQMENASHGSLILENKMHLQRLDLYCTPYIKRQTKQQYSQEEINRISEIFETMTLPPCLDYLTVYHFFGYNFPSWMMSSCIETCFPNLTFLGLYGLISCTLLPPLGRLPNLKSLTIQRAFAIRKIGPEILGSCVRKQGQLEVVVIFPKLERLWIENIPLLQEWSLVPNILETANDKNEIILLPSLETLSIKECPVLKSLPEGLRQARKLEFLQIEGAHNLREVGNFPFVLRVHLFNCSRLISISNLPALHNLLVGGCLQLECIDRLNELQLLCLGSNIIMECPKESMLDESQPSTSQSDQDRKIWNIIWKSRSLHPASRMLLLRIVVETIPVKSNQRRTWPDIDLKCLLCETNSVETPQHLFLTCPFAKIVWFSSPLSIRKHIFTRHFKEWLINFHESVDASSFSYGCILLLSIWKEREPVICDGATQSVSNVINRASALFYETQQLQLKGECSGLRFSQFDV